MDSKARMISPQTWEEIAPEYRKRWQERFGGQSIDWVQHEPYYRFGYEMAFDPFFEGKRWIDVEADLRLMYPEWSEQRGYKYEEKEGLWERFKDSVKEAWESVTR